VSVNLAYLYALPLDELRGVSRVGEKAATALVGVNGARFVALTGRGLDLRLQRAAILGGRALLFAMARDGVFLPAAAQRPPALPHAARRDRGAVVVVRACSRCRAPTSSSSPTWRSRRSCCT
jgi:hypothetical protein